MIHDDAPPPMTRKRWSVPVDPAWHALPLRSAADAAADLHARMDAMIERAFMRALELGVPLSWLWLCHGTTDGNPDIMLFESHDGPPTPNDIGCTIPRPSDTRLAHVWLDYSEFRTEQRIVIHADGIGL